VQPKVLPKQVIHFVDKLMPSTFCELIISNKHFKVEKELTRARHIPVDIRNEASQSGWTFYGVD
jgi:hypothetical protein